MENKIILEQKDFIYLLGDTLRLADKRFKIHSVEMVVLKHLPKTYDNINDLLSFFSTPIEKQEDAFVASLFIFNKETETVLEITTNGSNTLLFYLNDNELKNPLKRFVSDDYEDLTKKLISLSNVTDASTYKVTDKLYDELYKIYFANEQVLLNHYAEWNKQLYNDQIRMLKEENYPLKITPVIEDQLYYIDTNIPQVKASSLLCKNLDKNVEDMANIFSWYISNNLGMTITEYVRTLKNDTNIYKHLIEDYKNIISKKRTEGRILDIQE